MSAEEVTEEVEALIAILEEDTVEVVKGDDGERPKVKKQTSMNQEPIKRFFPSTIHTSVLPRTSVSRSPP